MCLSAARDDSRVICKCDMELARDRIEQVLLDIPRVFRSVGDSNMAAAADKVLKFVELRGLASFEDILHANYRHVSKGDLAMIIETLLSGRIIKEYIKGGKQLFGVPPPQQQQQQAKAAQTSTGGVTP